MTEDAVKMLQNETSSFERERDRTVNDAIAKMREELVKQQAEVARLEAEGEDKKCDVPKDRDVKKDVPAQTTAHLAPMIYLSYPLMTQQNPHPAWVIPLRTALINSGYHVYTPWITAEEQFKDPSVLNDMPKSLVPQLCAAYRLQNEILMDYEVVLPTLQQADRVGDFDCTVFRNLWFLIRSSLIIADVTAPERLGLCGVLPEMVYARMLDIPIIGVAAESGYSNPWINHCTSVLYTGQFNLAKFSPLIRGFAPLPE